MKSKSAGKPARPRPSKTPGKTPGKSPGKTRAARAKPALLAESTEVTAPAGPFRIVAPVLLRAPLLPVRALGRGAAALRAHPLGEGAVTLASRELGAALGRVADGAPPRPRGRRKSDVRLGKSADPRPDAAARAAAALDRYARRAAFRPTPSGWLAGVATLKVGGKTRFATGAPSARLRPAWARLAAIARELLAEPGLRGQVGLRFCPSLVRAPDEWAWLLVGAEALTVRAAAPERELLALAAILDGAPKFVAWHEVRTTLRPAFAAAAREGDSDGDDPVASAGPDNPGGSHARVIAIGREASPDAGGADDDVTEVSFVVNDNEGDVDFAVAVEAAVDGASIALEAEPTLIEIGPGLGDEVAEVDVAEAGDEATDEAIDDWLLMLIDEGLVCHDLGPPLLGPPPDVWLCQRLEALAEARAGHAQAGDDDDADAVLAEVRASLAEIAATAAAGDVAGVRARLAELPGPDAAPVDLHAGLVLGAEGTVAREALERAARVGPLLFRLQAALAAPAAERTLDPQVADELYLAAETFGAGAFDFSALALGGYGTRLCEADEPERVAVPPPAGLVAYLVELLTAAAQSKAEAITLDPLYLEVTLPPGPPPPSFEIFLTPAREAPKAEPGTGWLLGHHAPAGASFGRFAELLGGPLTTGLADLAAAEAQQGFEVLDVVHAASLATADLSVHPPVRARALALTGWPADAALTPAELALVIDEAGPEPLGLRAHGAEPAPVAPSPLHRVRSTTVPAGLYRLLAGWSFQRQHAPWSFAWGVLAGLANLPRVVLDGFVIAPRSWRLPDAETCANPTAFARWRREQVKLPRWVQVGEGDELLPVDLQAPSAGPDLARHAGARAFEIWPPLDRLPDADGRRVELVAAVVTGPELLAEGQAAAAHTARAGDVPPPALVGPAADWLTFRLYGPRAQQDALLFEVVAPTVAAARAASHLGDWFFLRYADRGSGREHLRVRVKVARPAQLGALRWRFERAFAQARRAGLLVAVETADYFPETARYGGTAALAAAEAIFSASSALFVALLGQEQADLVPPELDRLALLVRAQDALARGLGLDRNARRSLGERRRAAFVRANGPELEEWRSEFRARKDALGAGLLADEEADTTASEAVTADPPVGLPSLFSALARSTAAACVELAPADRAGLLAAAPALLHLQAVRFCGADALAEHAAYVFWTRSLEGLAAQARQT